MKKFLNIFLSVTSVLLILLTICSFYFTSHYEITTVSGSSMAPTLHDENILIVKKTDKIKDQDIVVVDARFIESDSVKNVNQIVKRYYKDKSTDGYYLIGDNKEESNDSRRFGEVPKESLIGVVKVNLSEEYSFIAKIVKKFL